MKFLELAETNFLTQENIETFFQNQKPNYLIGESIYPYIDNYLVGVGEFSSKQKMVDYIQENFNDCILEDLAYAKFKYLNWHHDKYPHIVVLDNDYIYDGRGNIKKGRHDVLGYNLHYSKDKKRDMTAINDIVSFAHLLKKNKKDVYQRIKDMYPEQAKLIRTYKPDMIVKLKKKDGFFWKKCSVSDLAPSNEWY